MDIVVIGAGYVGLVTSVCLSLSAKNKVTCFDIDAEKITCLQAGQVPLYEPGLEAMLLANQQAGRLHFSTIMPEVVRQAEIIFIAVGTPSSCDGAAEVRYVLEAASSIAPYLKQDCVIVDKSTVPIGMADQVKQVIQQALQHNYPPIDFSVVSNPEFLREGAAIEDFMHPDRVIIGIEPHHECAKQKMLDLYLSILDCPEKILLMSLKEAEMTKYVTNAMLATRISFINEMALLCDAMGIDIENIRLGIGSDSRIGCHFLRAGCGYGGSCLPKDMLALAKMAEQHGIDPLLLRAVSQRNDQQKQLLLTKVSRLFGDSLDGMTIGLWGLAFKPETDDMREASAVMLIEQLVQRGACVKAYDPVAMPVAERLLSAAYLASKQIILTAHQNDVLLGADALVLVTEWTQFSQSDLIPMKCLMRRPIVIDGRNQYDPQMMRAAGFYYEGVGRGVKIETIPAPVAFAAHA